jgi:alkanesulfonate monooxygenase SsuD/methylene tetrahydromethanopterin reductase-like flavin-dependent oxidoreductase (luciferase family)
VVKHYCPGVQTAGLASNAGIGLGLWLAAVGKVDTGAGLLERAASAAAAAEATGFDSVWLSESALGAPGRVAREGYPLLGALAVRTGRARLGVVPVAAEKRSPSILAKIVTGIDVISHGRAVLSLDDGSSGGWPPDRLAEALQVCRSVLEDERPTFTGRFYALDGAVNRPAPVHQGGIPVVVFVRGSGPRRDDVLEVAARWADVVVVEGGGGGVREAVATIRAIAGASGLSRASVCGCLAVTVSPAALAAAAAELAELRSAGASGCLVRLTDPCDPSAVQTIGRALRS